MNTVGYAIALLTFSLASSPVAGLDCRTILTAPPARFETAQRAAMLKLLGETRDDLSPQERRQAARCFGRTMSRVQDLSSEACLVSEVSSEDFAELVDRAAEICVPAAPEPPAEEE